MAVGLFPCSVAKSCLTLFDPQASLCLTISESLPKFMSIGWVMPSNHLISGLLALISSLPTSHLPGNSYGETVPSGERKFTQDPSSLQICPRTKAGKVAAGLLRASLPFPGPHPLPTSSGLNLPCFLFSECRPFVKYSLSRLGLF